MLEHNLKNNPSWEVKEVGKSLSDKLTFLLKAMARTVEKLERLTRLPDAKEDGLLGRERELQYQEYYTELLSGSDRIRRAIIQSELAPGLLPGALTAFYGTEQEISLMSSGDTLVIRTPDIGSRRTKNVRGRSGSFSNDYTDIYSREVDFLMCQNEELVPKYRDKILITMAVYDKESVHLPDNDNLDTKKIVDAITGHMRGSDAALHCFFYRAAIVSQTIRIGTYFIVIPMEKFTGKLGEYEQLLQEFYPEGVCENEQNSDESEQKKDIL